LREAREEGAEELCLLLDESFAPDHAHALAGLLADHSPVRSVRLVVMSKHPEALALTPLNFPVAAILRKPLLRAEALLDALRAKPDGAGIRVAGSRTPFETTGAAVRREPHVLVVDDDAISRSVSSQLLERLGCVVEVALSGAEAVAMAQGSAFDLIFMDCQMPEMDGFAATEKIRAAAGNKAPPIVALTANISEADRQKCFAVGMRDFVGKPVNRSELARVLKRWTKPVAPGPL
jgi:CheY-like chemotaxis protein